MNADARKQREIEDRDDIGWGRDASEWKDLAMQVAFKYGPKITPYRPFYDDLRPYLIDSDGVPPTAEEREKLTQKEDN